MEDLPDRILVKILRYSKLKQISCHRLVCKKFCYLAPLAFGNYLDVSEIVGADHPTLLQNRSNDSINYYLVRKNLQKISLVLNWLGPKIRILIFKNRLFEFSGGILEFVLPNLIELRVEKVGSRFWANNSTKLGQIEILETFELHPECLEFFPHLKQLFSICTFDAPDKIQLNLSEWKVLEDHKIDHDDPDADYSLDFFADDGKFDRSKFAFIEEFHEKESDQSEEEEEEEEESESEDDDSQNDDSGQNSENLPSFQDEIDKKMGKNSSGGEISKLGESKMKKSSKGGDIKSGTACKNQNFGGTSDNLANENSRNESDDNENDKAPVTEWETFQSTLESPFQVQPISQNVLLKLLDLNHLSDLDSNVATSVLKELMSQTQVRPTIYCGVSDFKLKSVKHLKYEGSLAKHEVNTKLISKLISNLPNLGSVFLSSRLETLSCLEGDIANKLASLELYFCTFVDIGQVQVGLSRLDRLKSFSWTSDVPIMVDWRFLQSFHDLEKLEIDRFEGVERSMNPNTFQLLPPNAPLKCLRLGGTLAGCDASIGVVLKRGYNLEHFYCRQNLDGAETIFIGGHQFKGLSDRAVGKLLESCNNLSDIDLLHNEYITDLVFDHVTRFGQSLKRLNLRGTDATYGGMRRLAINRRGAITRGTTGLPRMKICVDMKLAVKPNDADMFKFANLYINPVFVKKCKLHRYTYTFTIVEQS